MKIYLVQYITQDNSGYDVERIEKAFSTLEKAEAYKLELETFHKDNIRFQYNYWWYEIKELEVE
jgi:hypothetical protein